MCSGFVSYRTVLLCSYKYPRIERYWYNINVLVLPNPETFQYLGLKIHCFPLKTVGANQISVLKKTNHATTLEHGLNHLGFDRDNCL